MHEFRVWAPRAQTVRVQLDNREPISMDGPMKNGWWCVAVQGAGPNTDYAFLVDDDPTPYPDPRSAWQPRGLAPHLM